jgi:hypothetical protein
MTKIYQGDLPQKINVVVERKVIAVAEFDKNGIYETNNELVIKELKEYGYKVEEIEETPKPRKRAKDID